MTGHEQIEKSVLGTMLGENYLVFDSDVKQDFFIRQIRKNIFDCMQPLLAKKRPVDNVTLLMMEPVLLSVAYYLAELRTLRVQRTLTVMLT